MEIKDIIYDGEGIISPLQLLTYRGLYLDDDKHLYSDYHIRMESTLSLSQRLPGFYNYIKFGPCDWRQIGYHTRNDTGLQLKQRICKHVNDEKLFDTFYLRDEKSMKEIHDSDIAWANCEPSKHDNSYVIVLLTKSGNRYYNHYKKKMMNKLMIIGYCREAESEFKCSIPMPLKYIIVRYYQK